MNATQAVITYLNDHADAWNSIAKAADPSGDGVYEDTVSVGIHARDVLDTHSAFAAAVEWDVVGAWLMKSFEDESGYGQ